MTGDDSQTFQHLVEIIPLKFPMGFPDDDEFDPAACRINHKGEFYYHPKLKVDEKVLQSEEQMKITVSELNAILQSNGDF